MKKISFLSIAFCLVIINMAFSETFPAKVTIDLNNVLPGKLDNKMFGGFAEPLINYINSQYGVWAQELYNRGFDVASLGTRKIAVRWNLYQKGDSSIVSLDPGGYNPNGEFCQHLINKSDTSECGVWQNVLASDSLGYDFYIYTKSNGGELFLRIESDNGHDFYETKINTSNDTAEWKKFTVRTNFVKNNNSVKTKIILKGKGECLIDEASLMETNNVDGIRYEYIPLFNKWNMGILRYPGGWYADTRFAHWKFAIGDIDKRKSQDYSYDIQYQRLDFGVMEYIDFCRNHNIEPAYTVNYADGTPEEAANLVEFFNGDTNTTYGKMRADLGYKEPINVKYFEIGNEQYWDVKNYAGRYIDYYNQMKQKDPTIQIICDGNKWFDFNTYDTLFSVFGNKCQFYGYHEGIYPERKQDEKDTDGFLRIMGENVENRFYYDNLRNRLQADGFYPNTLAANTEWGVNFNTDNYDAYLLDTNAYSGSLEVGLATTLWYMSFMRYPDLIKFTEKIWGIGCFKRSKNKETGKRSIYGNLSYESAAILSRHFGENVVVPDVLVDEFTPTWYPVPWIEALTTFNKDSVYIYIVNRNPDDSVTIHFKLPNSFYDQPCKLYQLFSKNYFDLITPDDPDKIKFTDQDGKLNSDMSFPPHSFTLIAMKFIDSGINDNQPETVKFKVFNFNSIVKIMAIYDEPNSLVEITDITGKIIKREKVDFTGGNTVLYDLTGLSSGMYLVSIKNAGNNFVNKLILTN